MLSACGGSSSSSGGGGNPAPGLPTQGNQGAGTLTTFANVTNNQGANNIFPFNMIRDVTGGANSGIGYAYSSGVIANVGTVAAAGLLPNTVPDGARPTSGTTNYTGLFRLVHLENFTTSGNGRIAGNNTIVLGTLSLEANFDTWARTVRNNIGNQDLLVNGTFDNQGNLSGFVSFAGITGDLDGVVGGNSITGVYHGKGSNASYAGGFYVD